MSSSAPSAPPRVPIGENFRFGHKAQGDPPLLSADGRFSQVVHPLLEVDGEIVSSSHIRGLLLAGEVAEANVCSAPGSSCAARSSTATSAAASSVSRPPTSCPTRPSPAQGTASSVLAERSCAAAPRRQHRRAAHLQNRTRRADRGLHPRLRRRPLRNRSAPALPRAPARRATLPGPAALIEQMRLDVERTREIAGEG